MPGGCCVIGRTRVAGRPRAAQRRAALKSELAVRLAQRGRPEAAEQMVEVQRITRESQHEVREVVRRYRATDLGTELTGAQGVLNAAGIDCRIEGDGIDLPESVQSTLGWVVREATTNVLRHGDARRCTISLAAMGGRVALVVENDGLPDVLVTPARPVPGRRGCASGWPPWRARWAPTVPRRGCSA